MHHGRGLGERAHRGLDGGLQAQPAWRGQRQDDQLEIFVRVLVVMTVVVIVFMVVIVVMTVLVRMVIVLARGLQ